MLATVTELDGRHYLVVDPLAAPLLEVEQVSEYPTAAAALRAGRELERRAARA